MREEKCGEESRGRGKQIGGLEFEGQLEEMGKRDAEQQGKQERREGRTDGMRDGLSGQTGQDRLQASNFRVQIVR